MILESAEYRMNHAGEHEAPHARAHCSRDHLHPDFGLVRKERRRDVEHAFHAVERALYAGDVRQIADCDFVRALRAHLLRLPRIAYETAHENPAASESRYDEPRKFARCAER